MDRLFKEAPDQFRHLTTFDQQVRAVVDVMDVEHLLRRLLNEALGCGQLRRRGLPGKGWRVCTWCPSAAAGKGCPCCNCPLNHHSHQQDANIGWLLLGSWWDGESYSEDERRRLQQSLDGRRGPRPDADAGQRRTIRTRPLPAHTCHRCLAGCRL